MTKIRPEIEYFRLRNEKTYPKQKKIDNRIYKNCFKICSDWHNESSVIFLEILCFYTNHMVHSRLQIVKIFLPGCDCTRKSNSLGHSRITSWFTITNQIYPAFFPPVIRPFDNNLKIILSWKAKNGLKMDLKWTSNGPKIDLKWT